MSIKDQPLIQWVQGALLPGVKRPGREADHSPHLVPKLRVNGAISPLPLRAFLACLEKTLPLHYVNNVRCSRGVEIFGPTSGCPDWLCRGLLHSL
jgi:hypothetical protein